MSKRERQQKKIEEIKKIETPNYAYFRPIKLQNVEDIINANKLAISVFKESDFQEIWQFLRDKIGGNEFQIMYSSLNIGLNSTVFISLPLLYYSFKQNCSYSSISYSGKDFIENHPYRELIEKLSKELSEQYFPLIGALKKIYSEVDFKIMLSNSIHRHPGDFGFSSTDLSKNYDNFGLIYRNLKANGALQIDSVIYINTIKANSRVIDEIKIADNLANIVTVEPIDDNISGIYENIASIALLKKNKALPDYVNLLGARLKYDCKFDLNDIGKFEKDLTVRDICDYYQIFTKHCEFQPYMLLVILMHYFISNECKTDLIINKEDFSVISYAFNFSKNYEQFKHWWDYEDF